MHIYRRNYKIGKAWVEFEIGGDRKRPMVSATNDKDAEREGKLIQEEMKAALAERQKITRHSKSKSLELDTIFSKYFLHLTGSEVSVNPRTLPEHHAQAHQALLMMLDWFKSQGITTIDAVDDEAVDNLVRWAATQYRYAKKIKNRAAAKGRVPTDAELKKHGLVSPTQVHAMTTKRLQCVFNYAKDILKLDLMGTEPKWRKRKPKMPEKAPRIMDDNEHVLLERKLPEGYDKFFEFCISSTLRRAEALIEWSDYSSQRQAITRRGKGGGEFTQQLTAKACAIIESCRGDHPVFVFTYVCRHGNSSRGLVFGQRYPINKSSLAGTWRSTRKEAGVNIPWHRATRATGATDISDAGGGSRGAQQAMRHKQESTTRGYLGVGRGPLRWMEAADADREARLAALRQKMPQEDEQLLLPAPERVG